MLNLANLEDSCFLEGPRGELLGELPVGGRGLLSARSLDRGGEPLVLKGLHGAEENKPGRVPSLHGRDKGQLGASRCSILHGRRVLLGVIAVCRRGCAQDGRQERAVIAEGMRLGSGEGQDAFTAEERLEALLQLAGLLEK